MGWIPSFVFDWRFWVIFTVIAIWKVGFWLYDIVIRNFSLSGNVVLVTGAGNGLGKVLCRHFAGERCNLVCVDIDVAGNNDTIRLVGSPEEPTAPTGDGVTPTLPAAMVVLEEAVREPGKVCETSRVTCDDLKAVAYTCDVSDVTQVRALADLVHAEFGHVDILVNNAGVAYPEHILKVSDRHITNLLASNLHSHFWTVRAFLPKMLEREKGFIVAISSVLSKSGLGWLAPYCASKYGVNGLMASLQQELRLTKARVKTLTVFPGCMNTGLLPGSFFSVGWHRINGCVPLPVASTHLVADRMIFAIKQGKQHASNYTPGFYSTLYFYLGLMPGFLYNFIIDLFRINDLIEPLKDII